MYTLGQAAKATGKGKTTIKRAIDSGKISASKDDNGHYLIDPSELHRVYSQVQSLNRTDGAPRDPQQDGGGTEALQAKLEAAEQMLADRQRTIDDLRGRLDLEAAERRQVTLRLIEYEKPKGFWRRLVGG